MHIYEGYRLPRIEKEGTSIEMGSPVRALLLSERSCREALIAISLGMEPVNESHIIHSIVGHSFVSTIIIISYIIIDTIITVASQRVVDKGT